MRKSIVFALAPLALLVAPTVAEAKISRLVVSSVQSPAFEGRTFKAGQYEHVKAIAIGALDPNHWLNRGIVNLEKAPRNAQGQVEYQVDVEIVKPIDLQKGNHAIFFDILNRGGKQIGIMNNAGGNSVALASDGGNGFLYDAGYSVVWAGWQGDVAPGGGRLTASFPIPRNPDGSSITGMSRDEFSGTGNAATFTGALSYPAVAMAGGTLTVRQRETDPRQTPPGLSFRWVNDRTISITRPPGFDAGALYEFVYEAKDPTVMGIGFAAIRDVVAYLKNERTDDAGNANPLLDARGRPDAELALCFGLSQSGRVLKDFLWQGFNADERLRKVFDGINPHISGARKAAVNYEFAQPGRNVNEHRDHLYQGDQFPFTYSITWDSVSRRIDGFMLRCRLTNTCPKVMHTDSELEIWQTYSSLLMTDTRGRPVDLPDDVRVFQFSGTQHVPAAASTTGACQYPSNPVDYKPHLRALAVALDRWARHGSPPPKSRVSRMQHGTLVPFDVPGLFPAIPNFTYTGTYNHAQLKFFDTQPPTTGPDYPLYTSDRDEDGNAIDGLRPVALEVPIATSSGWNIRGAGNAPGALCDNTGSYFPFPKTIADRVASRDSRPSLEERYRDHDQYVHMVKLAVKRLRSDRLLLDMDADALIGSAEAASVP